MPKLLGQPPRVRGRQPAGNGRVLDVRTTPAGAGTTWTAAWVKDAPEEAGVALARLIASPGYPFDERAARATAERITDTGIQDAEAQSHQIGAQWHGPAISTITKPTLVLHGDGDPLVKMSGARATAARIPGARLVTLPGVGHDLPQPVWDEITTQIRQLAEAPARSSR